MGPPTRPIRKILHALHLWRPAADRSRPPELSRATASDYDRSPNLGHDVLSSDSYEAKCKHAKMADLDNGHINSGTKSKQFAIAEINCNSLGNKFLSISELILDRELDVLVVCESRHSSADDVAVRRSIPKGYNIVEAARDPTTGRFGHDRAPRGAPGGGLVIYHREQFSVKKIEVIPRQASFEFLCVTLASLSGPITVVAIYRPGSAHLDQVFFREFTLLLESIATFNSKVIIVRDLNVYLENPNDIHAKQFAELLTSFGLTQHIDSPTHNKGGILDLLITRSDCVVENLRVDPPIISDHGVISGTLPHLSPTGAVFTTRQVRGWKKLDHSAVRTALQSGPLCQASAAYDDMDAGQLFDLYDSTLRSLDKFVPIHAIKSRFQPSTPWFDDECRTIKRQVRMLERWYRR